MSERDEANDGSLVPAGRRELTTAAGANSLVSRGIADLDVLHRPAPKANSSLKEQTNEIVNSIGLRLLLIPAGRFLMGSPNSEGEHRTDEGPQHEVEITRPFYMGIYQVTQEQFNNVMGKNPSHYTKANGGGSRCPVENISWEDAFRFCHELSERSEEQSAQRLYRLPTEAEWEYACRGGAPSSIPFHFGHFLSSSEANFDGNYPYGGAAKGPHLQRTTPVGSYKPNAFGLFDMHGNVWEFCQDWYNEDYYNESPRQDPQGPGMLVPHRVRRGGSFLDHGGACRSAYRARGVLTYRNLDQGFRVVCVTPNR